MTPLPNMLDRQGRLPAGALAILADFVCGFACATVQGEESRVVTSLLGMELAGVPGAGDGPVTASAEVLGTAGGAALATGRLTAADGTVLGHIHGRFAVVPASGPVAARVGPGTGTLTEIAEPLGAPDDHPLLAGTPLAAFLGARVRTEGEVTDGQGTAELEVVSRPAFGNERGGLHGGIGALFCEQASSVALAGALPPGATADLGSVRVSYLRPIPVNGQAATVRARVVNLGRSQAILRAELLTVDGKPAVTTDALYAIGAS